VQESAAKVTKDEAAATRATTPPTTNEITNARAVASRAGPEGSPEYNAAFNAKLDELTAPKEAKGPGFGADAERASKAKFGKPFADLTPAEAAEVDKDLEARGLKRSQATAAKLVLPGQNALVDIPGFRAKVQDTIRPQLQAVTAADNALITINDSMATGNFISFNAARVQLAKSLGDNQLSRRDVEQAGGDPSILGGLADTASTLFTGTPTLDTQNKIKRTLEAIKTVATKKANAEINRQRKIALRTPGYNPEAVDAALDFPEFQTAPPAAGGGTLAEQAAAILKSRQSNRPTAGGQ
jgi:hypothetical protein